MKDNYFSIQTDKLYKRIGFFILFGLLINLSLFFATSYLENKITHRSFITSYIIYCIFLGIFHSFVYRKYIVNFITMTFAFFFIGLAFSLFYFVLLTISFGVEIFTFLAVLIAYLFFQLATLKFCFKLKRSPGLIFVTILIFVTFFSLTYTIEDFDFFYYGFSFISSVWFLNITLSALLYTDFVFYKNQQNIVKDSSDKEKINVEKFENYLKERFESQITYYEIFNQFHLFDIDCFPENYKHKLTIQISSEDIKFSTVTKEPSVDFSLYDYVIETNKEAEDFVEHIMKFGWPKDLD